MRRGTRATWQGRPWPMQGEGSVGGAHTSEEATQVHTDACEGRHVASGEISIWRAHGLVGPS